MTVTPLDIQSAEFKNSFNGYNKEEVDEFLNKILTAYEDLYKENQKLKDNIKKVQSELDNYKNIEDNLSATLVLAQKNAHELKNNAQKEAELIIEEANYVCKKNEEVILQKINQKEQELNRLTNEFQSYKLKMLSFIETQYRLIKGEESISVGENDCD